MNRFEVGKGEQSGFMLLEVLIAVLVFSLGILAIVGLQATMIKNANDGRYRAIAAQVAEQRIAQRWANPGVDLTENDTDISAILPSGSRSVVQAGNQVRVTVTWQQPGNDIHQFTTVAFVDGN